ncbi:MAG: dihydrofolate reductase family protein [Myxococcales bacterium]|nr:dihydrofolate reductase family protein [Myxococcales bacterium]
MQAHHQLRPRGWEASSPPAAAGSSRHFPHRIAAAACLWRVRASRAPSVHGWRRGAGGELSGPPSVATAAPSGDPATELARIKQTAGPNLTVLGSGSIVAQLTTADLVDEVQLMICPVVLGVGKSQFAGVPGQPKWKLARSKTFKAWPRVRRVRARVAAFKASGTRSTARRAPDRAAPWRCTRAARARRPARRGSPRRPTTGTSPRSSRSRDSRSRE